MRSNETNIGFNLIQKSHKVEDKVEKIESGSFKGLIKFRRLERTSDGLFI